MAEGKTRSKSSSATKTKARRKRKAPETSQEIEDRLTALAYEAAEKQLREGTAPPSVVLHFLRMGSTTEKLEQDLKRKKGLNLDAKTESIQTEQHVEALFTDAIEAMRVYQGGPEVVPEEVIFSDDDTVEL